MTSSKKDYTAVCLYIDNDLLTKARLEAEENCGGNLSMFIRRRLAEYFNNLDKRSTKKDKR